MDLRTSGKLLLVQVILYGLIPIKGAHFNRKHTGVEFSPYIYEDGSRPYSTDSAKTMLEVTSTKFSRLLIFSDETWRNGGKTVTTAEVAANINQERNNLSLTIIIGILPTENSNEFTQQADFVIHSSQTANSIFPGTVEGHFLYAEGVVVDDKLLKNILNLRKMSSSIGFQVGIMHNYCNKAFLQTVFDRADSMAFQRRVLVYLDFILCDIRPDSTVANNMGAIAALNSMESQMSTIQDAIKSIKNNIQVGWLTGWEPLTTKRLRHDAIKNIRDLRDYWLQADAFAVRHNYSMFMESAIGVNGWWKLKRDDLINNHSGYAEYVSDLSPASEETTVKHETPIYTNMDSRQQEPSTAENITKWTIISDIASTSQSSTTGRHTNITTTKTTESIPNFKPIVTTPKKSEIDANENVTTEHSRDVFEGPQDENNYKTDVTTTDKPQTNSTEMYISLETSDHDAAKISMNTQTTTERGKNDSKLKASQNFQQVSTAFINTAIESSITATTTTNARIIENSTTKRAVMITTPMTEDTLKILTQTNKPLETTPYLTAKISLDTAVSSKHNAILSLPTILAIILGALLSLAILVGLVYLVYRKRIASRYEILTRQEIDTFMHGSLDSNEYVVGDENFINVTAINQPYNRLLELTKEKLKILSSHVLGGGEFGCVFKALLTDEYENEEEVALKTTKPNAGATAVKGFLSEIKILTYLGEHPNIVPIIGAYTAEMYRGKVYIAIELCHHGSLKSWLKNCRETLTARDMSSIPFNDLIRWSYEIACGMEYLEEKAVIHADLATRNVLLSSESVAKITDFGLSRRLYEYTNYTKTSQEPLPWRWMAHESLKLMEFSSKSDVWSYAVTLWEIFSLGAHPYPGVGWTLDFVESLECGFRLKKPEFASFEMFEIMERCWVLDRHARPTFADVKRLTRALQLNAVESLYTSLHQCHEDVIAPESTPSDSSIQIQIH